MNKTVAEWLMEVKLYDKKIKKAESKLFKEVGFVITSGEYALKKDTYDNKNSEIKAKYVSYKQLIKNRDKILKEIIKFNAETEIEVAGEKMPLAFALDKWNKRDSIENPINQLEQAYLKLEREKERFETNYKLEKDKWTRTLIGNNKTPSGAEQTLVEKAIEGNIPKVFDSFNVKDEVEKAYENLDKFLQEVNVRINIANSTNKITINLDEPKNEDIKIEA